jgi:hypothetical protein
MVRINNNPQWLKRADAIWLRRASVRWRIPGQSGQSRFSQTGKSGHTAQEFFEKHPIVSAPGFESCMLTLHHHPENAGRSTR